MHGGMETIRFWVSTGVKAPCRFCKTTVGLTGSLVDSVRHHLWQAGFKVSFLRRHLMRGGTHADVPTIQPGSFGWLVQHVFATRHVDAWWHANNPLLLATTCPLV